MTWLFVAMIPTAHTVVGLRIVLGEARVISDGRELGRRVARRVSFASLPAAA